MMGTPMSPIIIEPSTESVVNKLMSKVGLRVKPSLTDSQSIQERANDLISTLEQELNIPSIENLNPRGYVLPRRHYFEYEINDLINDIIRSPNANDMFRLAAFILENAFANIDNVHMEAIRWYFAAVQHNVVNAYKSIANISQLIQHSQVYSNSNTSVSDIKRFELEWLRIGTEIGDHVCASNYGILLIQEKKYSEAFKALKIAARQGNYIAMNNVACCYLRGYGVAMNGIKGVRWLKKSAGSNSSIAKYNLSRIYSHGIADIIEDDRSAEKWHGRSLEDILAPDRAAVLEYLRSDDVDYTMLLINNAMMVYV